MPKRDAAERAARKKAFAVAYETPGPTFHNATESYLQAVEPTASRETAAKGGARYLRDPMVQAQITASGKATQLYSGMTKDQFVEHCMDMEARMVALAEAGGKGAAMAAARYMEHAGKALGFFVKVVRDETPNRGIPLPRTREEMAQLHRGIGLMLELSEPNPLPPGQQLAAGAAEADYEVVDDAETEREQGSDGTNEAPSHE